MPMFSPYVRSASISSGRQRATIAPPSADVAKSDAVLPSIRPKYVIVSCPYSYALIS